MKAEERGHSIVIPIRWVWLPPLVDVIIWLGQVYLLAVLVVHSLLIYLLLPVFPLKLVIWFHWIFAQLITFIIFGLEVTCFLLMGAIQQGL